MNIVCEQIKKIRKSKNISQEEMAKNIGMKTNTYRDLENSVSRLRLEDLLKICEILKINLLTLVKQSNEIILVLDKEEINLFENINKQIQEQKIMNDINISDNHGTINIKNGD